jgi:hypothetical protein
MTAGIKANSDGSGAIQVNGTDVIGLGTTGNINIPTSGARITGDFTNATVANRVMFQTSTANSNTVTGSLPAVNGDFAGHQFYGASDTANSPFLQIGVSSAAGGVGALLVDKTGTGTYRSMTFYTGGSERMRIDTSGNVGIGTSSPTQRLHINAAAGTSGVIAVAASAGNGGFVQLAGNGNTLGTSSFDLIQGGDNVGYVYNRVNAALVFGTNNTERARITSGGDFQYNNGYGSIATVYGCRAWANWNGALTGTNAPRAGGNVTSVTRNALGNYTINFTTAMPDANYATLSIGYSVGELSSLRGVEQWGAPVAGSTRVQFINGINTSQFDPAYGNVAVFR